MDDKPISPTTSLRSASFCRSVSLCGPYEKRLSRTDRHSIRYGADEYDALGHRKMPFKFENTYRMAPEPNETFRPSVAKAVMDDLLKAGLEGKEYSEDACRNLTTKLASDIKKSMQKQSFSKRYKYVCLVSIGEKRHQGVQVCSRCLWNTTTDNFASAVYSNRGLFAVASLYAVYLE